LRCPYRPFQLGIQRKCLESTGEFAYQRCLQNLEHGRGSEDVAPLWFCKCLYKRRRINENMVWTDSQDYDADEILYTARTVLFDKTNRLMREITTLFEVYPRLFYPVVPWLFFPKGVSLDSPNALSFPLRLIIRSKHQFCGAP